MLVKYWLTAFFAAMVALTGIAAQAQESGLQGGFATGYAPPADCCKQQQSSAACDCTKGGECCCEKKCVCGKDKVCAACKDEKSSCCKEACKGCCAANGNQAKKPVPPGAIIVHVPVPMMPVCGSCPTGSPYVIHQGLTPPGLLCPGMPPPPPPMPMPARAGALPPPVCCPCPMEGGSVWATSSPRAVPVATDAPYLDTCLPVLSVVADLCGAHLQPTSLPSICLSSLSLLMDMCPQGTPAAIALPAPRYVNHPPQYVPPSPAFPLPREMAAQVAAAEALLPPPHAECPSSCFATIPVMAPPAVTCANVSTKPSQAMKMCIAAKADSNRLEMRDGEESCMSCKSMVVKVGGSEIVLTCVQGQVRVRGEALKVKADRVRTDRKSKLILDGSVVLSYQGHGQSARVSAEHIELDLANGSLTIKQADKPQTCVPIRYDAVAP